MNKMRILLIIGLCLLGWAHATPASAALLTFEDLDYGQDLDLYGGVDWAGDWAAVLQTANLTPSSGTKGLAYYGDGVASFTLTMPMIVQSLTYSVEPSTYTQTVQIRLYGQDGGQVYTSALYTASSGSLLISLDYDSEVSRVEVVTNSPAGRYLIDDVTIASQTPIPAGLWVLGAGILSMAGIRRLAGSKE